MNNLLDFVPAFQALNITLTENQMGQFIKYYELLIEKNKVMNLTAITEFNEVVNKHFIDSLSIVKIIDMSKGIKVLDLGTGAGFPGIPLKIAFPDLEIILLDSLNKRVNFLNDVIDNLGLINITAIHGRAEEYGKKEGYREGFDICVSRAVAKLSTLAEYCIPYVKVKGSFISYKAGNVLNELEESKKAIGVFGGKVEQIKSFCLPGTDIERTLINIKKTSPTPKSYPRSGGKPTKEPII